MSKVREGALANIYTFIKGEPLWLSKRVLKKYMINKKYPGFAPQTGQIKKKNMPS
jgi:hypothetical protein